MCRCVNVQMLMRKCADVQICAFSGRVREMSVLGGFAEVNGEFLNHGLNGLRRFRGYLEEFTFANRSGIGIALP